MYTDLKRFFHHTAFYTIGNLLYRGASFLLVPLYAHRLSPAEYGTLELIYVTVFFIQVACGGGLGHAALRFYYEYDDAREKKLSISTTMLGALALGTIGCVLIMVTAPWLSTIATGGNAYVTGFRIIAITMVLEISREISLAFIRAREKSRFFIVISLIQLFVQVAANVATVVYLKMGIIGILLGNLVATFAIWVVITRFTFSECGWLFNSKKFWEILRYANPVMLSMLASSFFLSLDRYFLRAYSGLDTTGVYSLGLRIAAIMPILLVTPFTNSYGPFRFSVMKQANANQVYARALTYFAALATFVTLGISAISKEIVRLTSSPDYWDAYKIVPLLLIAGALTGVNYCLNTGVYIQKRSKQILIVTIWAGVFRVIASFWLIPKWGMLGAAVVGVLAWLYTNGHTYMAAQKLYPIDYEFGRLAKLVGAGFALGAVTFYIDLPSVWESITLKIFVVALYPFMLLLLRLYTPEEINKFKALGNRWLRVSVAKAANA